jgi:hypothetical protein
MPAPKKQRPKCGYTIAESASTYSDFSVLFLWFSKNANSKNEWSCTFGNKINAPIPE